MDQKRKCTLLAACLGFVTTTMAHEKDSIQWKPDFGLELTSDLQGTHTRDVNNTTLLRLNAAFPITRGLTLEVATISTGMTTTDGIGDDLQCFSNIDGGNIPLALAVGGLTWQIPSLGHNPSRHHHTLSAGIRTMNEDYFISDVTALFTNSSCGIYPTISNYPIADYPVASVGIHYRYEYDRTAKAHPEREDKLTLQASLYNGTAYNRFYGRENVFRICPQNDGLFALTQIEYQHGGSNYFLGTSFRGEFKRHAAAITRNRSFSSALWAYTEQQITDRLHLIAGYSHAFGDDNNCTDFAGLGGRYTCTAGSRHRQLEIGLFTDYAHYDDLGGESATELTCKVQFNDHFYLQPTAHFIVTPSATSDDGNTFKAIGAIRLGIAF